MTSMATASSPARFRVLLLAAVVAWTGSPGAEPEVVVYGGTPSGIAASVTAARSGASVVLVEPTRHVGGLNTSGLTTAEAEHMLAWTLGGFAGEFYRLLGRHYGLPHDRPAYEFESGVAERTFLALLGEAGVTIRYGAHLAGAAVEDSRITRISLSDGSNLAGGVFIDASYEGDLMAAAGVSHTIGREGRDEFGESLGGVRFDTELHSADTTDAAGRLLPGIVDWGWWWQEGSAHPGVMCYNFRLIATRDPEHRVPFPEPRNYDASRFALLANWLRGPAGQDPGLRLGKLVGLYPRRNGKIEMNNKQSAVISLGHFGGQFAWPSATPAERQRLHAEHLDYTLGFLHFLATDPAVPEKLRREVEQFGLHRDEFADNNHLPYQLYVREGRRMRGALVMRQQDVRDERRKDDSIGMGSHFIDSHHVRRLAVSPGAFVNEGRIWRKGFAYQIPYRSLVPKPDECTNLLVPVAASFTHVAYCTLRVEGTWMVTGHAAGVAAAIAARDGLSVQEVPVPPLQEMLRKQGQVIDFLPGKPEQCGQLHGPPEF